ncbi:hypothetical protein EX30DRAFT_309836 [Ascodesmis nigricans]|uniref:RSE1/DDB1/CPSF1 first beta-propeller domain-containing protein n=1 Tax=Ascodesmis nigricans TaxID=341454 RepID=A0A4S2MSB9_9PEZI|nr:hypothetical protein EX30DRAFT_309836 [Ascodesmis nigricans]
MISSAFLIVTEISTFVARAADVLSGNATFSQVYIPAPPRGGGLITAWARPIRHPVYAGDHDDIYLAMENGDIYFIEADTKGHNLIQTATKASHLDCAIDTAFASLDNGLDSHDILVAGGAMSSGGVYLVEIRPFPVSTEAKLEETVTNWAPVMDFDLLNPTRQASSNSTSTTTTTIIAGADRDRVYACTGRGDHGAITELRYGVQARILSSADYVPGIIRLFILPDAAGRGYFVLAAFADHSQLLFLNPAGEEEWCECVEEGLGMEAQTLAAGGFEAAGSGSRGGEVREWAVQVTLNAVTVAELRGERYVAEKMEIDEMEPRGRRLQRTCQDGESIVAAAVMEGFVLIVTRTGVPRKEVSLNLAAIMVREESEEFLTQWGTPVSLGDSPTFRRGDEQHGRMIALVGTRHATVRLYHCDPAAGLIEMWEQDSGEDRRESGLFFCESSAIIHTATAAMMLCGLRNGTVLVFKLEVKDDGLKLYRQREIKFGPIPIQIHLDARRKDSAFVLAGPELYRFDLPHDVFRGTQIVFKDTSSDPAIQAIVQVDNSSNTDNIIVGAMRDQIFYADIGQSERLCGRRLRLYETPRRMLFFRHHDQSELRVFVVACSREVVEMAAGRTTETVAYSTLRFLDPISWVLHLSH